MFARGPLSGLLCSLILCATLGSVHVMGNNETLVPDNPMVYNLHVNEWLDFRLDLSLRPKVTDSLTVTVTTYSDGDPDLFGSFAPNPRLNAPYRSRRFSNDSITLDADTLNGHPFVYFAVNAWRATSFSIVASFDGEINLVDGLPQNALVADGAVDYFKFSVDTSGVADITISLAPDYGRPQLFVSTTEPPHVFDPSTYQWNTRSYEVQQSLLISKDHPNWPSSNPAIFYIAVYGVISSRFAITAAANTQNTVLQDGVSQVEHAETDETEYFVFNVTSPSCELVITVTPITGDPDIYVSTTIKHPTSGNNEFSGNKLGADEVHIPNARVGPFYIGVYSFINSTFTILAKTTCASLKTATRLQDGVPQTAFLQQEDIHYYRFQVGQLHRDVTFTLTKQYGDPDLFLKVVEDWPIPTSQWPDPSKPDSYDVASTYYGDEVMTIRHDSPHFCHDCSYLMAVYAFLNTTFSLTASTGLITLQAGVPVQDDIYEHESEYFQLQVDHSEDVRVTVTELGQGDPDVYISRIYQFPNSTHHEWHSASIGGDVIDIPPTDPNACTQAEIDQRRCVYYIAVKAYSVNSSFTIVADFRNSTVLQDGIPQFGIVQEGAINYYEARTLCPQSAEVTFSLGVNSGNADMYISTTAFPSSKVGATWRTSYFSSQKTIMIARDDDRRCHSTDCTYKIAVFGWSNTSYSISSSTLCNSITLQNGRPYQGYVERGEYSFFRFRLDSPGYDISLVLTPLSGDPDMYVSAPKPLGIGFAFPTNSSVSDKNSRSYQGDVVDYDGLEEQTPTGYYYIGVHGFTTSTFTISAIATQPNTTSMDAVTDLYSGIPQNGFVHHGRYRYYRFNLDTANHHSLRFTLSRMYGDPDMYVNKRQVLPTKNNADFSSNSFRFDVIDVPPTSIQGGQYLIGVYGYQTSSFSLSVATDKVATVLRDGHPQVAQVSAHQYVYYQIGIDTYVSDLTVTVTPVSGDPDLYVAEFSFPNRTHYQYSASAYREDSITVPHTRPGYCANKPCVYYIAVYGFTDSVFTISANFEAVQSLQSGVPQHGRILRGAFKYYQVEVASASEDLTIAMTPDSGIADLYVSVGYEPHQHNYTWYSSGYDSDNTVVIRHTDSRFCTSADFEQCIYYIGVYGITAVNFTIVATTSHDTQALSDGIAVRDYLDANQFDDFLFQVTEPDSQLSIIVTAITGDPDLYVSHGPQCQRPRPNLPECSDLIRSQAFGSDLIVIDNANTTGPYYISVFAYTNATFTITAYMHTQNDTRQVTRLVAGQPQAGTVSAHSMRYYQLRLSEVHAKLDFSVSLRIGDPDIFVNYNSDPEHATFPTRDAHDYAGNRYGADLVTISPAQPGVYTVGVLGFSHTIYTLLAAVSDASVLLLTNGVSYTRSLAAHQYEYYIFNVDRLDQDLTVTVTPFTGDPDLFISSKARPNITFNDYAAQSYLDDSITIRHRELRMGPYYISTYAWSENATFTITVTFTNETSLQDGSPVSGTVPYEAQRYYTFQIDQVNRAQAIMFTVTPFQGQAWLYVSQTEPPLISDYRSYQWRSRNPSSTQNVRIAPDDPHFNPNQTMFYVMVYGYSRQPCNYSIVASTEAAPVRLRNRVPQRLWVQKGHYAYFYFEVTGVLDVVVTVTPLSGDPDVYASYVLDKPKTDNYTFVARQYGADVLRIRHDNPNFQIGTLHIGVYAFLNSTFNIVATGFPPSSNSTTVLLNGIPQAGAMDFTGDYIRYTFTVPSGHKSVTFSLTPLAGDPDLYIRNDGNLPTPGYYQWAALSYTGRDIVHIPEACRECTFDIMVHAATAPTAFNLVANTDDVSTHLAIGQPLRETLGVRNDAYYVVTVDEPNVNLTITVQAFSGDPDLYVSFSNHHPNFTDHDYASLNIGDDSVTIPNAKQGDWYIAVNAFLDNSTFTIIASTSLNPISLVEGVPQTGDLYEEQTKLYAIFWEDATGTRDLNITLTLLDDGKADLFVTNNGSIPSRSVYRWSSVQSDQQRIRNTVSIPAAQGCKSCTYLAAVIGDTPVNFNIMWSSGQSQTVLLSGVASPLNTVDKGSCRYYRYYLDSAQKPVSIMLTSFSGNADLYVNNDPNKDRPCSRTDSKWYSEQTGDFDVVKISAGNGLVAGIYYIGVRGIADSSTYSVIASNKELLLRDGAPQSDNLDPAGNFYFFRIGSSEKSKDIGMFLVYTDAANEFATFDVYISTNSSNRHPTQGNNQHHWRVTSGDRVNIDSAAQYYCSDCTYYIGIFGAVSSAEFQVTISTANALTVLTDGRYTRGDVAKTDYAYYLLPIPGTVNNLTIVLEPCLGDVDLFVSQAGNPTKQQNSGSSTNHNEVDSISVNFQISVTTWYVGVYGRKAGPNGERPQYLVHSHVGHVMETAPEVNPLLAVVSLSAGAIQIIWNAATSAKYQNNIHYNVYVSRYLDQAVMYSPCGLLNTPAGVRMLEEIPTTDTAGVTVFKRQYQLLPGESYVVNVVANVSGLLTSSKRNLVQPYNPTSVTTRSDTPGNGGDSGGISKTTIISIAVPVLLVILAVIVYLAIRNRKLSQELEIEMHDVPKPALRKAVRGPTGAVHGTPKKDAAKKYSQLLTEDEEEDEGVGTEYAPPDF